MKFIDFLKVASSGTSAASLTLGAAEQGCRTLEQANTDGDVAVGDTDVVFVISDNAGNREMSLFTIASTTQVTRTQVLRSTAGGTTAVTFSGSALNVYSDVPASWLEGQELSSYLPSHSGGSVLGTDLFPGVRGSDTISLTADALAAYSNAQSHLAKDGTVIVRSAGTLTLDASVHNRVPILVLATGVTISTPTDYSSLGDGFRNEVINACGGDIALAGFTVLPSGGVVPAGTIAQMRGMNGTPYAMVQVAASTGGTGGTAPGQVTGLTAGTATDTTQPLSWTAVSGATAYEVEYKLHTDTAWTVATTGLSGTTYSVTGLTALTSYDYRVTASNTSGAGTPSATVTKSTAAGGGGTANAPTAVSGTGENSFPTAMATYAASNFFQVINPPAGLTITSANCAISTSDTIVPDASITFTDGQTAGQGKWGGAMTGPAAGGNYYGPALGFSQSLPTQFNIFYWVLLGLSDGSTVNMVYKAPIPIGDSVVTAWRTTTESASVA